ncbi:MAG: cupin domain-containing protein [Bryobacteraceae bacterium]
MKRFFAGVVMGWLAFALLAQQPAGDRVVRPLIVVDNQKVKVSRWLLQPGERSPVHTHTLDHVYIVVRGSRIREHISDGSVKDDDQETGRAAFSAGRGKTHWFENVGTAPYEMISVELKQAAK